VLPSRVTLARMREASWGRGAGGAAGRTAGRAGGRVVVLAWIALDEGVEDSAVSAVAGVPGASTLVRGVVHAVRSRTPRIGEMRALPDMNGSLSCVG
jgi:hypothetical protein